MVPSTNLLFAGIKGRIAAQTLSNAVPGGVWEGEAPERTVRPYAVVEPVTDEKMTRTNRGRYDRVTFKLKLAHDTFEQAGAALGYVDGALNWATLTLTEEAQLVDLWSDGPVDYSLEQQIHTASQTYTALVKRNENRNPN